MSATDAGAWASERLGLHRLTAVDLVTIAGFAAAWRAIHLTQKLFNVVYPLNVALWFIYFALALFALLVIVSKPGTAGLFFITASLINFFLEGETTQWMIIIWMAIIFTELIPLAIWRITGHYCDTPRTAVIGSLLLAACWGPYLVFGGLQFLFQVPVTTAQQIGILGTFLVTAPFAALAGHYLGRRLKPLLGY
jgi:FtsH-binding integral membrane protein